MVVAVGEACKMVWEGVGSARGRPQAGRTSRQERERERRRLSGMPRGRESDGEKGDSAEEEEEEEEEEEDEE